MQLHLFLTIPIDILDYTGGDDGGIGALSTKSPLSTIKHHTDFLTFLINTPKILTSVTFCYVITSLVSI
jgi:hypothetical protein